MMQHRELVGYVPQIVKNEDYIEVTDRRGNKHKVQDEAEANDLIMREERAIRSKLRSIGWTDNEIELTVYGDDVVFGSVDQVLLYHRLLEDSHLTHSRNNASI